jgi:hypothetical protein
MQLLSFETIEGQEGSYNDLIKQLVKKTRYYYSEVSGDEFKVAIPELKTIESKIQFLDREFGNEHRDYISEILDELGKESETENLLLDELKRTANVLIPQLDGPSFNIDNFAFDFANHKGINIIEFYGYKEDKQLDSTGNMFKDILKSLAYRYNVIFIDSSRINISNASVL